jgi:hypothetical protein
MRAVLYYERSLRLNPGNENATRMLQQWRRQAVPPAPPSAPR